MDNIVVTRREEILGQLDEANAAFAFPDLNHGYYYAIDVRLHAYGDDARWALIVETVGYNPRGFNVYDVLHVFGNCLIAGSPGFENGDFLARIDNLPEVETPGQPETYRGGTPIVIRSTPAHVSAPVGEALADTFRRLVPVHRELLLADAAELRRRIPADLPELLVLDQWHQPDLFEMPPSASEVCEQIADVLVTVTRAGTSQP
jgi:hypothetical protein